ALLEPARSATRRREGAWSGKASDIPSSSDSGMTRRQTRSASRNVTAATVTINSNTAIVTTGPPPSKATRTAMAAAVARITGTTNGTAATTRARTGRRRHFLAADNV